MPMPVFHSAAQKRPVSPSSGRFALLETHSDPPFRLLLASLSIFQPLTLSLLLSCLALQPAEKEKAQKVMEQCIKLTDNRVCADCSTLGVCRLSQISTSPISHRSIPPPKYPSCIVKLRSHLPLKSSGRLFVPSRFFLGDVFPHIAVAERPQC